jgi:signal transduction histidine kinase
MSLIKGVHLFFQRLVASRSVPEDAKRREFILNVLLTTSVALSFYSGVSAFLDKNFFDRGVYNGVPPLLLFGISSVFAILFLLSRKGYVRFSSWVLVVLFGLSATYASFTWGADLPWSLLTYAFLIVITGVLLGVRSSMAVTFIIVTIIFLISYLQTHGQLTPLRYWRGELYTMSDATVTAALCIAIAVVSWLFSREIERSLKRARASEAALKEERDLLEIKVRERTRELERLQIEKMAQVNRFAKFGRLASGFFHDLMSPLSALSINLERLKTTPGQAMDDVRGHLDAAMKTTQRMEDFIVAIKKQIQNPGAVAPFCLNTEIEDAIRVISYRAQKANVRIRFSSPENVYTVGSPIKFTQIVTNLLGNALDASDEPSVPPERRVIDVALSSADGVATLTVRDQGIGIPLENRSKIFESFFSTKDSDRGMGIGLTIVQNIVESDYGGKISVDSAPGAGSTFTVTFPLVQLDAGEDEAAYDA